jgi:preprotein translocase SecE subunit
MAVAVKNTPETAKASLFDQLPIAVLAGIVYFLASLAIVFKAIPALFASVSYTSLAIQAIVMTVVAGALVYVGARLIAAHPARGLLPGIFVGLCFLLVTLFVASWIGFWVQNRFYDSWFLGSSPTVGSVMAGVIAILLLAGAVWLFLRPGVQSFLGQLDDQGWFSIRSHKRSQGIKVRRGTILGIGAVIACGIFIMVERAQVTPDSDWAIDIPFTGATDVQRDTLAGVANVKKWDNGNAEEDLGSFESLKKDAHRSAQDAPKRPDSTSGWPIPVDRFVLRDFNEDFKHKFVKVKDEGDSSVFRPGDVVTERDLEASRKSEAEFAKKPQTGAPDEVGGQVKYEQLTLLPHTKSTLPLLLAALGGWFAWRVVNVPMFADFLIATEAELNKVSWMTRRRLLQDTIVVLVTVFLTALFLFAADAIWSASLKWIGVLKSGKADSSAVQEPPW